MTDMTKLFYDSCFECRKGKYNIRGCVLCCTLTWPSSLRNVSASTPWHPSLPKLVSDGSTAAYLLRFLQRAVPQSALGPTSKMEAANLIVHECRWLRAFDIFPQLSWYLSLAETLCREEPKKVEKFRPLNLGEATLAEPRRRHRQATSTRSCWGCTERNLRRNGCCV